MPEVFWQLKIEYGLLGVTASSCRKMSILVAVAPQAVIRGILEIQCQILPFTAYVNPNHPCRTKVGSSLS